jgi:hypothetical protein
MFIEIPFFNHFIEEPTHVFSLVFDKLYMHCTYSRIVVQQDRWIVSFR